MNLTTPGTIIFDPGALGLNPAVPNVFNFTTINVGAGVTVVFTSKNLSGPIYWLAQGAVTINGTLNLNGENGHPATTLSSLRVPAAGGAGGYSGGVGGSLSAGLPPAEPGTGPGGGAAATGANCAQGSGGTFSGSQYLIPLIGGSGGGGGQNNASNAFGSGGGGGGGAILIASSTSITVGSGAGIYADGGGAGSPAACYTGGDGSGGAIRLIAPTLSGNPSCLCARGNLANAPVGTPGIIRLEYFTLPMTANGSNILGTRIDSAPLSPAVPTTAPSSLKVTSLVVAGTTIPINSNPFSFPDATINASGPVTVNVQAQYIPTGTVPKIFVMSETGPDQSVSCSAGLAGTLQQSTCSAQITFPSGGSRGFVQAKWQ